jgi:hypothetical protein
MNLAISFMAAATLAALGAIRSTSPNLQGSLNSRELPLSAPPSSSRLQAASMLQPA